MNYALAQWSTLEQLAFIVSQMGGQTPEDIESMAQHLRNTYRLGSIQECRKLVLAAIAATTPCRGP